MADVSSFQAQAICIQHSKKEALCSDLVGKEWPLRMIHSYADYQVFGKDYDYRNPTPRGIDVSPASVRYFWEYEKDALRKDSRGYSSRLDYNKVSSESLSNKELPPEDALLEPVEFETYTAYVQNYIASVNAFRKFYVIARREPDSFTASIVEYSFELLEAASEWKKTFLNSRMSSACSIPATARPYYVGKSHSVRYFNFFPILEAYEHFMEEQGHFFQKTYGNSITFRKNGIKQSIPFWRNPGCHVKLVKSLREHCASKHDKSTQYVTIDGLSFIRKPYLHFADNWISWRLSESKPIIDSESLTILWECRSWEEATYMKLFCDMINTYDPRGICAICGQEFSLGSRANKKYCPRHTPEEVRSYQQKIKNMRDKTSQA